MFRRDTVQWTEALDLVSDLVHCGRGWIHIVSHLNKTSLIIHSINPLYMLKKYIIQGRYNTLLAEYRQKTSEPNMYGFNDVVTALEQSVEPPKYCAEKFAITVETGRAEKTRMNFSNVTWKNDRVVGFDAVVSVGKQQTQMRVTPIFLDNGMQNGVTVEVKKPDEKTTQTYTWKTEDSDKLSFNAFSQQVIHGVNPLQILGSSQVQIGNGKAAFLAVEYDKEGSFTRDNTRAIMYGITKEPTAKNALKREIRDLEKTAPIIVKDAVWKADIRELEEKQLVALRDDIRAHLEHEVKEYRFRDEKTFKTLWGDTLQSNGKALFQVQGNRVVNEGSFVTENGKYVHDLVFVLSPKPVAVCGTIDGKKVGMENYFEKPARLRVGNLVDMKNISNTREGNTLISNMNDAQGMLTITTENKVSTKVDAQWNIDANAFTAMRNTDGKNVVVYKEKDRPVGIIPSLTTTFSDDEKRALNEKHIKIITTPDEFKQVMRENVVFVVVNIKQQGTLGSAVSVVYLAHSGGGQPTVEAMEKMPFHSNYLVLLDSPILDPQITNVVHVEHLKTTWIGNMSVTITPSETYHVVNTWNGSPSTRNHDMTLKENKQLINKALEEMYKCSVEFRVDKLSYQRW